MKTTSVLIGAATLAFAGNEADAFVIPAGRLTSGGASSAPLASRQSSGISKGSSSQGTGCSCGSCSSPCQGRSCGCPSCSSALSARSHSVGCRCGSCSVRMQAHPEGCGCVECSTMTPAAFHDASCTCACCAPGAPARTPAAVCLCGNCRKGSSVTVMGMGGSGEGVSEATSALRERVAAQPESVMFEDTMAAVADGFVYTPKRFVNGATSSDAGVNEGSCKVFALGKIAGLSEQDALACFGEHYRGVLADPAGDSHGNIRAFIESGWDGVDFPDGLPLSAK